MEGVLGRIVAAAVSEVGPVEHAGITEVDHRRVYTRAASGDLVHRIDAVQYRTNQGPCLDSLREQVTVRCDDLTEETRWPKYAKAAVDEGLRSLLSVQLFVHGANLGALNLYARDVHAFSDDDESTAMLLASHAAVAMKGNEVEVNLRTALASRDRIGQAKGILMERYKISDTEAFDLLVLASQRTHRKLRDVADELAATGELRIG
ncbi:GAF domain-containing protein [Jatrophihabitans endophyticus]|uniref:GAF domain-containing protein n=2 Tax=Jatrophihabitans endophyticus TaxID=1206085 RepID=A0A1M5DV74_9ACTN|nr:GAF domain-containing protein [Jatrophihabitans endophyticus]